MIVCDRCGKSFCHQGNLTAKIKAVVKMEPNRMYPASHSHFIDYDIKYDLCQECLDDVLNNLREFVNQGKFNGELK